MCVKFHEIGFGRFCKILLTDRQMALSALAPVKEDVVTVQVNLKAVMMTLHTVCESKP